MKFLDLTLPTPAENLACDEALLDLCDEMGVPEILRVWEPAEHFVVVGYANKVAAEVNVENCCAKEIPILRRCSGGGTVMQGPGCLNYSLILSFAQNAALRTITETNRFVMKRHQDLFQTFLGKPVEIQGHTDLAINGLKFSGNAQRRKKTFLLFHGSVLLNCNISLIEQILRMPSQQPCYRKNRSHENFLTNLGKTATELKIALRNHWNAAENLQPIAKLPESLIEKYRSEAWNCKF
jgi:lipoate-protein ligase A